MSIINRGNHEFEPVGTARWRPDGWDLDTLVVPMKGSVENYDAYIATLQMWEPSGIDGSMFLSDWVNDGDPVWPTVDLIYIGKKGGFLPPVKHESTESLQNISFEISDGEETIFGIDVQYKAPVNTAMAITRTNQVLSVPNPVDTRQVINWMTGGFTTSNPGGITQATIDNLINHAFGDLIISTPKYEELVPGRYFRNSISKTLIWTR